MTDDPRLNLLMRDEWAGLPATRGSLPRVPSRPELPTASEALAGCLVRIPGGSGVADATYECQKQAAGTYAWVQIDGGSSGPLGLLGMASGSFSGVTVTTVIATVAVTVGASRAVRCIADMEMGSSGVSTALQAQIRQDGTALNTFNFTTPAVAATSQAHTYTWTTTPAAGAHTYTLVILAPTSGSAAAFGQLVVEDIGAAV